jgi:hypothetical protein
LSSVEELGTKILTLEGKPQIDANGKPTGRTISKSTAKQYSLNFKKLVTALGCDKAEDLGACLRKTDLFADYIDETYPNSNTAKSNYNSLVAPAKYIPELKAAYGSTIELLRERMLYHIKKAETEAIEATGSQKVESLASIKKRITGVKRKFGDTSPEYVAAVLQTSLKGLRGELATVKVVGSVKEMDKYPNAYYHAAGKIRIKEFKTKQIYEPYLFTLKKTERPYKVLDKWLKAKKPKYLLGNNKESTGKILRRALGVGVLDIRHSMISELVNTGDNAGTEARLREIAPMFKHNWTMTTRYYRNTDTEEDVDEEDR